MTEVTTTRCRYPPIATCEGPDQWMFEHPDPARMRREARKHAADTGHMVRVDQSSSTVYRAIPEI